MKKKKRIKILETWNVFVVPFILIFLAITLENAGEITRGESFTALFLDLIYVVLVGIYYEIKGLNRVGSKR